MLDQDGDFVSVCDFARYYYYEYKWQIMPLSPRSKIPPKDFPAINLQKGLVDAETFERMWGKNGVFIKNYNCGVLCGDPSGGLFVVDLDTQKPNSKAQAWWDNLHAMRPHPETPTQVTGSGGTQIFFKMPDGMKGFNHKSAYLNVDFQGEGAYVVLPPSIHPNGKSYRWVDGLSPDDCELMILPDYLIEEIQEIIGHRTDGSGTMTRVKTGTPDHQVDPWGKVIDGREDLMTRMVFKAVLEMYRDCPIIPSEKEQSIALEIGFKAYVSAVDPRLNEEGQTKEGLLEQEGRGISLYRKKWQAAIRQWDEKISTEAARPFVKEEPKKIDPFSDPPPKAGNAEKPKEEPEAEEKPEENSQKNEKSSEDDLEFETKKKKLLKLYTIEEIEAFGPVKALVQDMVAESSLGFIYGAPGCGKTFIALSLGLGIAYGKEKWLWGKNIERSGPVIYISLEGKADLGNRLKAWKSYHGISHNDDRFRAVIDEVNFLSDESIKLFVDSIDDYMSTREPPVMIFIDTVSRAIAGGGENDSDEISKFIQTCDRIKTRYTANVTGIHHSNRLGTNMRGSSAFDGGADFMFRIERAKDDGLNGTLYAEKIKAYADKWEQPFRLAKIDLDAFGAQSSLVATSDPETISTPFPDPNKAAGFGGTQETGYTTIGKKLPDHVWKAIFDEAEAKWNEYNPWSESKNAKSRYAAVRIWNLVQQHAHGIHFTESDAEYVLKILTGRLYLEATEYTHNKMTKIGLKVINRPNV